MPIIVGILAGILATMLVAAAAGVAAVLNLVGRSLVNAGAKGRRYRKAPGRKEGEVAPVLSRRGHARRSPGTLQVPPTEKFRPAA